MILKKPYAFFIKNFKLFHFIIFVLSSILLYKTSLIYSFMKEYTKTSPNVIGKDLTSKLFSPWLYILIIVIIIVNILIIVILIKKDKPYIYYMLNITLYTAVLTTYIISNNVISNMQTMVVTSKTTLAIRDITNIARLLQTISIIFYLIRTTGFDLKKFDFVRDLQGLNIAEEDSEEIEVGLELERNEILRDINKTIRYSKYYYRENKFIINIIIALSISLLSLLVYLSANKYAKVYKEDEYFNAGTITMGVKESSIVTNNYKKIKIVTDEYSLVAVKILASSSIGERLQNSRILLVINEKQYYNTTNYSQELIDLGNEYNNEELSTELTEYLLTYKIPKEEINSKMTFRYIDNIDYKRGKTIVNSIDVELEPKKIDEQKESTKKFELTNEIDMGETTLKNYKTLINNYEIKDKFENIYNTCISKTECYDFKEVIMPSVERNQKKAVLKINGSISYEKALGKITDIYNFIEKYGTIEYTYNGKEYIETNDFNQIIASRTKEKNVYFIEVNKDLLNAERIKLSFNIRNNKYEYILKGEY